MLFPQSPIIAPLPSAFYRAGQPSRGQSGDLIPPQGLILKSWGARRVWVRASDAGMGLVNAAHPLTELDPKDSAPGEGREQDRLAGPRPHQERRAGYSGPASLLEAQVLFSSWEGRPRFLSAELISPGPLPPGPCVCARLRRVDQCPGLEALCSRPWRLPHVSSLPLPCTPSPVPTPGPSQHTHAHTPLSTGHTHPYVIGIAVVCCWCQRM